MLKLNGLIASLLLLVPFAAQGAVVFASAPLVPLGQSTSLTIASWSELGVRFHIATPTQVTAVGGSLSTLPPSYPHTAPDWAELFAAIYPLSSATAFPNGAPSVAVPVASTVFTPDFPSTDFRTPLSVVLQPGWYGLVFGAGAFGSPSYAVGQMDVNGFFGEGPFFEWGEFAGVFGSGDFVWDDSGNYPTERFVVEGQPVAPEPDTLPALAAGLLLLFASRRKAATRLG